MEQKRHFSKSCKADSAHASKFFGQLTYCGLWRVGNKLNDALLQRILRLTTAGKHLHDVHKTI